LKFKNIRKNIEDFLDGPGNIAKNRENKLGRLEINHKHLILGVIFASIILSLVFYLFPQIDLYVSNMFFEGHRDFLWNKLFINHFYHRTLIKLINLIFIVSVLIYILGEVLKRPLLSLTRRRAFFIILSVAIAAGLMTNFIFKEHWGRSRPRNVIEFGGPEKFTAACVISQQCKDNCSFVSGEVSYAFCLISFVLLARRPRKPFAYGILIFASSVAAMRVITGGHFLSDVVLAGLYTVLVILLLEKLLILENKTE
jgi:lipid A 4'-phosphatase